MRDIQREIRRQKGLFLQAITGITHLSAKKYLALNYRLIRAVAAYGVAEVLVYLRSINSASVAFVDIC